MRWISIVMCIAIAGMVLMGCEQKNTEATRTEIPNPTLSPSVIPDTASSGAISSGAVDADSSGDSKLEQKSRMLAKQIVAGLFEPLMDELSVTLSNQTTQSALQSSWDSVSANLTGYAGIDSVEESKSDEYEIVLVTLRYSENQGRTIKFVYDTDQKISGLWFDSVILQNSSDGQNKGDYEEKSVTIGRQPYELKGKLTLPSKDAQDAPVVILYAGRANADMEGTIGAAKNMPLQDMAHQLAEKGIASFRYNRRAYQYANLIPDDAGGYDLFLEDAKSAVEKMFNTREINSNRIFILAQGEAVSYLPALVEQEEKKLSGALVLGGKPMSIQESYVEGDKTKSLTSDASYFMKKNMTFPLFILQAESDYETPVEYFERWQTLLKGRANTTYRSFEGLNHLFMKTNGKKDATDYDIKGSVSSKVLEEVINWCSKSQ